MNGALADAAAPWVDHGVVPPRRLPAAPLEIAAYLADTLGHPVYERWTWARLVAVYGALPDARRAKPTVCRQLIDAPEVVEAWQRGRLRALPAHGTGGRHGRERAAEGACQALSPRGRGRGSR